MVRRGSHTSEGAASKARAELVDALRAQIPESPPPDFETRLALANLLLEGGRRDDARRALLTLADEALRNGARTRALAVLRRMDAVWPDSEDVEARLTELARFPDPSPPEPPEPRGVDRLGEATSDTQPVRVPPRLASLNDALPALEALLQEEALAGEPATEELWERLGLDDRSLGASVVPSSDVLDLVVETLESIPFRDTRERPRSTGDVLAGPLFSTLLEAERAAILRRLRVGDYEPGDVLVTEGEEGQSLFVLSRGIAKVFVRSPTGRDVLVAYIEDGGFFGELSTISGRRRTATVVAATRCEVLELSKNDVDEIARAHPGVRDMLDDAFVQRASHPAASVARTLDITAQGHVQSNARRALESRFGRGGWEPRVRVRLARALIDAGHEEEALPILAELASALLRLRRSEKAELVIERIQRVLTRDIEDIPLAPLRDATGGGREPTAAGVRGGAPTLTDFQRWLARAVRERPGVHDPAAEKDTARILDGYGPGLYASPLFEGLSREDLVELLRGLRIVRADQGDVLLTEGEQGESLFALLSGTVKVWARDGSGRNRRVCRLDEGTFFGEVATLSGRPRCASVTAAAPCVLLEIRRGDVETLRARHPWIGEVLEAYLARRSGGA